MTHGLIIGDSISVPAVALGLGSPADVSPIDYEVISVGPTWFTLRTDPDPARVAADLASEHRCARIPPAKPAPHVPPWARKRGKLSSYAPPWARKRGKR